MATNSKAVTVTNSSTLISDGNEKRQELIITNNSVTTDVFIGPTSTVTTASGLPLYAGQTRERSRGFSIWLGPVYGIANGTSADIRAWETER